MSTRCQIRLFDTGITLYRHCDGYPDTRHGVLQTVAHTFALHRLLFRVDDSEYAAARFVQAHLNTVTPDLPVNFGLSAPADFHGDEEHSYWLCYDHDGESIGLWHRKGRDWPDPDTEEPELWVWGRKAGN